VEANSKDLQLTPFVGRAKTFGLLRLL